MCFVVYELDNVVEDNADAGEVFIKPPGMEFAAVSEQNEWTFFATEDEAFDFANKHNG